jgi:hypothetical protein
VLKINLGVAMCIIAAVSTVYYVFGGLKGVAWITLLHSAVQIVGISLILGVALYATGGMRPMMEGLPRNTSPGTATSAHRRSSPGQSAPPARSFRPSTSPKRSPGHPPTVLDNGDILLPIFYCNARPGEKWVGSYDTSAVRISSDGGKTWQEYQVPDSTGCVHMDVS